MSIELKIGKVWKIQDRYWEITDVKNLWVVFRVVSENGCEVDPAVVVPRSQLDALAKGKFLGEARVPKIGQVFKRREDGELVSICGFDEGKILFSYVGDISASFWYPSLFKAMEKNEYLGEMPVVGGTYIRAPNHVRKIVNVRGDRVRVKNLKTDHEYQVPLISVLRSYKPFKDESKPSEAIVLKVGQVWKFGPGLWEVMEAGQQYSTIRVHPNGEVCKSSTDSIICNLELFKAVLLGEMPKIGDVFERAEWRTEIKGLKDDSVVVERFPNPNGLGYRNTIKIESLLTQFKKFEAPPEPEVNSVFFDRKTNSIFVYGKKDGRHTLRNLKTNMLIRSLECPVFSSFEFLGILPKHGDLFKRNGQIVGVSRIERDQVFCELDNHRLYGRESKIPLYVLLTTYVPCGSAEDKTIANLVEEGYLVPFATPTIADGFAHAWKKKFYEDIDRFSEAVRNDPSLYKLRDWGLSMTGRKRSEPEMPWTLFSSSLTIPKIPENDALVKMLQEGTNKSFSLGMTQRTGRVLRPYQQAVFVDMADYKKPYLTLLPQVGDVYSTKNLGVEGTIVKVGLKKVTIANAQGQLKIHHRTLIEKYKWVR